MSIVLVLLLSLTSLFLTAMASAFNGLSTAHLRYYARQKDKAAKKLYPLKARGSAVLLTLELVRALMLSGSIIMLSTWLSPWTAWLVTSLLFFLAFVVLTQMYLKPLGLRLLATTAEPLLNLTNLLKPVTLPLGRVLDRFIADEPVTMTKADLVRMVEEVNVDDTDLSSQELRIISHALSFGDKIVHSVMTPWSVVASVKVSEELSPIVLDELHKSGHSRFPVTSEDRKDVVGLLYMHDLTKITEHAPKVKNVMHPSVTFVHEDRELDHALQAFLKSKQHIFIVVNSSAEVVGLVSIDDIFEQIIGKPAIDEFDKYDDKQAVAESRAKTTHKQPDDTVVE